LLFYKKLLTKLYKNNITILGHSQNTNPMVTVDGGIFIMNNGSAITGNINIYPTISGGGVIVSSGTFTMIGGTITGNIGNRYGGGVYAWGGIFTMRGGTISGNTVRENGGGVHIVIHNDSVFTKTGGIIIGYTSDSSNGNVVRDQDGYILGRRGHTVSVAEFNSNTPTARKESTAGTGENMSFSNRRVSGAWDN
jgi:hypothetical protein